MNPLVSICCITYNQEKYVEDTLRGFLIQKTNFSIEILIHDDASTDHTPEILKRYEEKDDRISVIYQSENKYSLGEKPLIKYLFPKANGKYISICEGDDYWTDPFKLQKQVDFLENDDSEEFVMCFHDVLAYNEKKKEKVKVMNNGKNSLSQFDLMIRPHLHLSSILFKNNIEILQRIYQSKLYNGDTALYNALGHFGKAKYLSEIEHNIYRLHDNGVWAGKDNLVKTKHSLRTYEGLLHTSSSQYKEVLREKVLTKRIMYLLALYEAKFYKAFLRQLQIAIVHSFRYRKFRGLGYLLKRILFRF